MAGVISKEEALIAGNTIREVFATIYYKIKLLWTAGWALQTSPITGIGKISHRTRLITGVIK